MSREHLLALDLGTTSVRALVLTPDGAVPGRAARRLGVRFPAPGRVEQDPGELWEASVAVLREALARAGVGAGEVAALGVVTQRATALAWDARSGAALAPAIGWQDQRAAGWAAELARQGIPITSLPSVGRFVWWLEHDAAVQGAAREGCLRLGNPDAWLTERLTGRCAFVTDPGQASCTGLFELDEGTWAERNCAFFGIEPDWLPGVVATSAVVGETPAELLGAPIPVAARAGDQQAACFAQAVHAPGQSKLTLGTSAMLDLHTGDAPAPMRAGVFPLALWRLGSGERAFCLEGAVHSAGAALDWLVGLGLFRDADEAEAEAACAQESGVVFVPALQGLGTPWNEPSARGFVGGLTRGSDRGALARATLVGVAQRCADLCDALAVAPGPLRVDGGLARSRVLREALANLTGREILRAAETETTALGAAWLAGLAVGRYASPSACVARLPEPERTTPRWEASQRAAERARWRKIVEERVR